MFGVRIFLVVALLAGATPIVTAEDFVITEDYVLPTGVTILTEEQLLTQVIGSTFVGGTRWVEYYEPSPDGQTMGRIKVKYRGLFTGASWTINGSLLCIKYDEHFMNSFNACNTISLDGNKVTLCNPDGTTFYPGAGPIKHLSGNPNNL